MGRSSCIIGIVLHVFVRFRLGRGCWVEVTRIASGLLNFRHCCALRLKCQIQVENIPIYVSSEGRIMPCSTIFTIAYVCLC
jgi:hypothetical protein